MPATGGFFKKVKKTTVWWARKPLFLIIQEPMFWKLFKKGLGSVRIRLPRQGSEFYPNLVFLSCNHLMGQESRKSLPDIHGRQDCSSCSIAVLLSPAQTPLFTPEFHQSFGGGHVGVAVRKSAQHNAEWQCSSPQTGNG